MQRADVQTHLHIFRKLMQPDQEVFKLPFINESGKWQERCPPNAPSSSLSQGGWEPSGPSPKRWPLTFTGWLVLHCKKQNKTKKKAVASQRESHPGLKRNLGTNSIREAHTVSPSAPWPCDSSTRTPPLLGQELQAGHPQPFHPVTPVLALGPIPHLDHMLDGFPNGF